MTLRRVLVLIKALPPKAGFWVAVRAAREKAKAPSADEIRTRQAHYRTRRRAR